MAVLALSALVVILFPLVTGSHFVQEWTISHHRTPLPPELLDLDHLPAQHLTELTPIASRHSQEPSTLATPDYVNHSPPEHPHTPRPVWAIQVGSFQNDELATALAQQLRQAQFPAYVATPASQRQATFRVLVGPLPDQETAEALQQRLQFHLNAFSFIVRYSPTHYKLYPMELRSHHHA